MLFSESIKTALDSIKSNATRSFLTALAIIIGIASVIAMLSIGAGAQQALEDEIDALGGRILSVYAGQTRRGGVKGSDAPLEIKDAESLRRFSESFINLKILLCCSKTYSSTSFPENETIEKINKMKNIRSFRIKSISYYKKSTIKVRIICYE